MFLSKIQKSLLLALVFVPAIYAQNKAVALMPGPALPGFKRSHAWIISSVSGPSATVHAPGQTSCSSSTNVCYYFPADILTAYAIKSIANNNGGAGMTVGIVDAFYNPQTEADLAIYVSFAGLTPCTVASGCLTIVSQTGGSPTGVSFNENWADETDLDVQTVHALAPNAKILLVATNSNSDADLGTGVLYARANANVVTDSWGGGEFSSDVVDDGLYYAGSSVPILFSAGDVGAEVEYPCSSPYVTCVGGTHLLTTATSFRNVESVWGDGVLGDGGTGGGCSTVEPVLTAQLGYSTCGSVLRGVPDIGALADPYTGFLVALGTNACGCSSAGIYIFGGTSLASPLEAAIIANIDAARAFIGKAPLGSNLNTLLYQAAAGALYHYRYYDVTTGSSGFSATAGWDLATGLGVPMAPSLASYLVNSVP
jgi:subtilase family serine protease